MVRWPKHSREVKEPWQRRQQKPHKFAYLTMKNSIFACFARAFFIFWHFEDVLVLYTTWNDLFCSCVDDVSICWQMFKFVLLCPKRWFQFNSRIVRTHFSSIMTLNNWKMIAETRSYIFRWRPCFRRRRVCLSSLVSLYDDVVYHWQVNWRCKKMTLSRRNTNNTTSFPWSLFFRRQSVGMSLGITSLFPCLFSLVNNQVAFLLFLGFIRTCSLSCTVHDISGWTGVPDESKRNRRRWVS